MSWNYRVLRRIDPKRKEEYLQIVETYYNKDGQPDSWTKAGLDIGEDIDEIKAELIHALDGTTEPILDELAVFGTSPERE